MEDRLKKVLQKKAVKNNFKNIETLPTLNTNLPPSTSSSAPKPDSSTVESIPVAVDATPIAVTVEDDVDVSGNSTDTTATKEGFGGRTDRKWGQRITIAFTVAITMAIILYGVLTYLFKKKAKSSFPVALAGFILFFISLLFGKECGFKTVTFDDFKKPVRIPGALTSLLGAVLYAPYCVLRLVAKVMAILWAAAGEESPSKTKNYREKVNHDADWITNSACEFFSIPLAYAFTCVLYFASDGPCARPGDLFASDILPSVFNKIFLPFSYIGPMLVYTIYGVYLPKFISFMGLEKIGKFFFLFIISWIMVYFFLPFLISSLLGVFQLRANPMIYIFILLGFVLFLATPDVDEIRRWSTYTWKYLIVLLFHLILVLILAPLTQVFFSVYVMYYFYSCQVKVSRLNIDLYPTNFLQELFNVRPDDILSSKTSNFLWMAYLIFFLWKIAELVMGHYNVPKINGVKLTGSFVANLILSVFAVIILFCLASSNKDDSMMKSVILSAAEGLGRSTKQGTTSQTAALGLLIFETYQMMTQEEKESDNNEKKPSYVKNKIYEILDDPEQEGNIGELNKKIQTEYNTVEGYFDEFAESLWEWSKNTNTTDNIYKPDDKKKSVEDKIRDYLLDTIEFFNKINDDTKINEFKESEIKAIPKRKKGLENKVYRLGLTGQSNKANKINHVISLLDKDIKILDDTNRWGNIVNNLKTPRDTTINTYNLIFPTYQQDDKNKNSQQDDKNKNSQQDDTIGNKNKSLNRNALLENKSILKYLIDKIKEFSKDEPTNKDVLAYERKVPDDVPNNDTVDINDVKVSVNDNDAVVDNTKPDKITMTNNPISSISQNNDEDDKNRGERMMEATENPPANKPEEPDNTTPANNDVQPEQTNDEINKL